MLGQSLDSYFFQFYIKIFISPFKKSKNIAEIIFSGKSILKSKCFSFLSLSEIWLLQLLEATINH